VLALPVEKMLASPPFAPRQRRRPAPLKVSAEALVEVAVASEAELYEPAEAEALAACGTA
jgi:hypothetical protein